MRRLVQLTVSVATATLALFTAAWAATGSVPLLATPERSAFAVSAQATGPLLANDRDGSAIFSAAAMAPGEVRTGEVTIRNAGDGPGTFTLSSAGVDDGAAGGGLSAVLELRVLDVTGAQPSAVFAGRLRAFDRVALGTLAAGDARRYRFEMTYPAGRAAEVDNRFQGVSTSVAFAWDAVANESPASPAPVTPTPVTPAPAAPVSAAPAAPAAPGAPAPSAAPARTAPATLGVSLGVGRKAVASGRLVTWMESTAAASARVTGTVAFSGRKTALRPTTVKLSGKRQTVRLPLPRAAVAGGAKRRLTVRLTVTATAGAKRIVVHRTLGVSTR